MRDVLRAASRWLTGIALMLLLALALGVYAIIGTETGTRWVLQQVAVRVPGRLEADDIKGTLLTTVNVREVRYASEAFELTFDTVRANVAWSRSGLRHLRFEGWSVDTVTYRGKDRPGVERRPFRLSMPPSPLAISVDRIRVGSLDIAGFAIEDVAITAAGLEADRLRADDVSARLAGLAAGVSAFRAQLSGDVEVTADVRWRRTEGDWRGAGTVAGSLALVEVRHRLLAPHPVRMTGTIEILRRIDPYFDLDLSIDGWPLGPLAVGPARVAVRGAVDDYAADVTGRISHEGYPPVELEASLSGDTRGLEVHDLVARTAAGNANGSGRVVWAPALAVEARLSLDGVDPAAFLPVDPGRLQADVAIEASGPDRLSADIENLAGQFAAQPVSGRGRVTRDGDRFACDGCRLSWGGNRASVDGSLDGRRLSLEFELDAPELSRVSPALAGSLNGSGRVGGTLDMPRLAGRASARDVAWQTWGAERIDIRSGGSGMQVVDVHLQVGGLTRDGIRLGGGELQLSGALDAVDADVRWSAEAASATVRARLAVGEERIDGELLAAELEERFSGKWALSAPFSFTLAEGRFDAGAHSWTNGEAALTQSRLVYADGNLDLETRLDAMPLAVVNAVLPERLQLDGTVDMHLDASREANGWRGSLDWSQRDTRVRLSPSAHDAFEIVIPEAEAEIRFTDAGAVGRASVAVDPGFSGSIEAAIDELSADGEILARMRFEGSNWDWVPTLFPEVDDIGGRIRAEVDARGPVRAPEFRGNLAWQEGHVAIPALNVPLTGIEMKLSGSSAGSAMLDAHATAGEGSLSVDGSFDRLGGAGRSFTLRVRGDGARLLDWDDYRLSASPDLTVAGDTQGIEVTGSIDVDRADIVVRELPEGAVKVSDDVVVAGEAPRSRTRLPVTGEVRVVLSENVHISGFGLDAGLEGELLVRQPATGDPTGEGELRLVDGVFEAYGQRLTIEEGTLIFTGPLDDPIVNVRAVRKVEGPSGTVTAGINLTGRARNPSSTLFSSPAMSDTDTLSYLVIGRPLEDISQAEGRSLSDSAFALGLGQAAFITNQIGQSLGLDQLDVAGSNQNTASLVAGKQLNPRLYARYAYGVFSQVGRLLLRYQLNERLTVELGAGESQSMDLLYIFERE